MFSVSMPNAATSSALVETATKWLATAASSPPRPRQHPFARGAGVGHRLQGREGLRGDDEQRLGRVEVAGRLGEVGAVDVGDEAERQVAAAVVAQRLVGHHRPEVGAADADVDDVADRPAGVPASTRRRAPAPRTTPIRSRTSCTSRDDVDPVDNQRALARHPQRDVQHGAVLGDVDPLPGEHRLPPLGDAALLGERNSSSIVSSVTRFLE